MDLRALSCGTVGSWAGKPPLRLSPPGLCVQDRLEGGFLVLGGDWGRVKSKGGRAVTASSYFLEEFSHLSCSAPVLVWSRPSVAAGGARLEVV